MKIKGPHKKGKYHENIRVINFENYYKFCILQNKEIIFFIFILVILTRVN